VVVVVDSHPGRPRPVVTAIEPIGAAHVARQVNRRMGLAACRLSEPHGIGGGYIRDGRSRGAPVREAEEPVTGGHPHFSSHPKYRPWHTAPRKTVDRGEIPPRIDAAIKSAPIGGVNGGGIRPIGSQVRTGRKSVTSSPSAAPVAGISRVPVTAVRTYDDAGSVGGHCDRP
jgi:hypothetical protein